MLNDILYCYMRHADRPFISTDRRDDTRGDIFSIFKIQSKNIFSTKRKQFCVRICKVSLNEQKK